MTAVTAPLRDSQMEGTQPRTRRLRDAVVLLRRNLVHMAREPLRLSEFTVQPVLFTLLFVYIFGSGVPIAGGYTAFAIAGLLAMNLVTSAIGTGIGLSADLATGVISRFRTLPMWRPASGIGGILAGFAIFLLFSYALSWGCACLGLIGKSPESAQGLGLVILFPLAIVSNALVPTGHMPAPIRVVADWNPVSAVTAAARHLWANPNPSAAIHAWPMQHPVAAALLWSVALIAILAPLATVLYRRRTVDQ